MGYYFSKKSKDNLAFIHPDLVQLFQRAITYTKTDFGILFPVRSSALQAERVNAGQSTTMNSRHIKRLEDTQGVHAGDVFAWVNGKVSQDIKDYSSIAQAMFRAAIELGIQIEWGGHWATLVDGYHFQLSWKDYP